jgi:hypothetical protein
VSETAAEFAARFWGGEDAVPVKCGPTYGPRDIDGGRPTYPAGWRFTGDGFSYRVYWDRTERHWTMVANDGGFATFVRELDGDWLVNMGWSGEHRRVAGR